MSRSRTWTGDFGTRLLPGAILAACVLATPAAAGPIAGSSILNTATGSFTNAPAVLTSNTVRAIVQPLEAVRLVQGGARVAAPGQSFAFAHRLTNLGNDTFDFRLDLAAVSGFAPAGLALVRDWNGNGASTPGILR